MKAILGQPSAFLDHVIEHHRDLRDRPADVHEPQKKEVKKDFAPRRHGVAAVVLFGMIRFVSHNSEPHTKAGENRSHGEIRQNHERR